MKRNNLSLLCLLLCLVLPSAAMASTAVQTLDFALNKDLAGLTNGKSYDSYWNKTQTFNGVTFNLRSENGCEAWEAPSSDNVLTIAANLYGVSEVYTLINSSWGADGASLGYIEFVGASGTSYNVKLNEGELVRDHFNNVKEFTDTLSAIDTTLDSYVQEAIPCTGNTGQVRLDMQTFKLPASFRADTLTSICFHFTNNGHPNGTPFLAGVSAQYTNPVPIPGAVWLLGSGLLGLIGLRRKA